MPPQPGDAASREPRESSAISLRLRWSRLFTHVHTSSLVYLRVAFYGIMLWEVWRFIDHNWVERYFTGKEFYFKYWPFVFVQPWPGDGMMVHFYVMGIVAVFAMLGLFYRLSATLFFFLITYVFLLEQARYLNHLYLICLISFLMILVPAHRYFSLDAFLKPALRSTIVPAWSVWLLRFQVGVLYFFGGIAKLNADWLRGEPLRAWLAARTDFPFLGQFFTNDAVVWLMNYGALFVDLFAVFLLINRRTRVFGFIALLVFHFMNSRLFGIGIFPWTMIAATAIFFEPDWPRRALRDLREGHRYRSHTLIGGFALGFLIGGFLPETFSLIRALIGGMGVAIAAYHLDEPFRHREVRATADHSTDSNQTTGVTQSGLSLLQKTTVALLGTWVVIQVLVPLRHFVIPGNVHWTEEGHNFSWHMKLRDKDSGGFFVVTDPDTGQEQRINPRSYLTNRQVSKMTSRPDMIVQFARYLEKRFREEGHDDVEVRAHILASLNGRAPQLLIDPQVDLTEVPYPWWGHADWILPLEVPLLAGD